jgi:hypothetical protein
VALWREGGAREAAILFCKRSICIQQAALTAPTTLPSWQLEGNQIRTINGGLFSQTTPLTWHMLNVS